MSNREHVVIIDDDASIRELLVAILKEDGYSIREFPSARDALEKLASLVPIAIFLDICMPDMSGFDFLRELRKFNKDVPVIVMTGYADHEVFRQTLPFHIADFLGKPFRQDVVRESLKKVLGRDDSFTEQFMETITFRLRQARLAIGLKQAEVASRCGMSTSQVSQIELRQSAPSVTTLLKLCKALNLKLQDLVEGF